MQFATSRSALEGPSIGELFGDLAREVSALVRHELRLASTELSGKSRAVARDVGMLAAGGAVAYAGLLALIGGIILLLSLVIPAWLAAMVVGVLVMGGGYAVIRRGLNGLKKHDLAPRTTLRSIQDDMAWAKREAA